MFNDFNSNSKRIGLNHLRKVSEEYKKSFWDSTLAETAKPRYLRSVDTSCWVCLGTFLTPEHKLFHDVVFQVEEMVAAKRAETVR